MIFTNPTAWFLLFLAVPIILFYILRIRLRQEPVQIKLKTTNEQVTVTSPSGFSQQFPVKSETVSLGMLPECGIWTIQDGITEPIRVACNLSNISESNLRIALESFYAQTPNTASLQTAIPIRFWLTIAALIFCVTE
jgi:hypothetical protein